VEIMGYACYQKCQKTPHSLLSRQWPRLTDQAFLFLVKLGACQSVN
jgi:hypothetical protein